MTEHPIIFSAPMVLAILAGRKTQTRRVFQRPWPDTDDVRFDGDTREWYSERGAWHRRARWVPGDTLWVKEGWQAAETGTGRCLVYRADSPQIQATGVHAISDAPTLKWRSSRFMPRRASRITLRVTDVRVERVQDISEADAIAEGMIFDPPTEDDREWHRAQCEEYGEDPDKDPIQGVWLAAGTRRGFGHDRADRERPLWACTARDAFGLAWNALNAKRGYPWDANPWVAVTTFERTMP